MSNAVVNNYWAERQAKAQTILTNKSIKETEAQMVKYYRRSIKNVIYRFEKTYNKLLGTKENGIEPTPADLYKLDTYWKMQGQIKKELQRLGDKQHVLLSRQFEQHFYDIYQSIAIKDGILFNEIDTDAVKQMINQIWCADGKSWSSRIWTNTEKLQEALNDGLIECVVTGKKTAELKKALQEQFKVSYSRASSIVETELAHIQTQAARQRYTDYGLKEFEVWAEYDKKRCKICADLHKKRYPIGSQVPIPAHPRCRCCIIPVVDD